jgi:hypothetical protein
MKAKTFDEKFDRGEEDIVEYLDLSQARRGDLKSVGSVHRMSLRTKRSGVKQSQQSR